METCGIFFKNNNPSKTRIPDPKPKTAGNNLNAGILQIKIIRDKFFRGYKPPNFNLLFYKTIFFDSINALGKFPGQF